VCEAGSSIDPAVGKIQDSLDGGTACELNTCYRWLPLIILPPPHLPLQVAAYNANDDLGTRSAASAAFQLGTVAPSVPRAVAPTAPTPLSVTLTFQAPASTGGSPITRWASWWEWLN